MFAVADATSVTEEDAAATNMDEAHDRSLGQDEEDPMMFQKENPPEAVFPTRTVNARMSSNVAKKAAGMAEAWMSDDEETSGTKVKAGGHDQQPIIECPIHIYSDAQVHQVTYPFANLSPNLPVPATDV